MVVTPYESDSYYEGDALGYTKAGVPAGGAVPPGWRFLAGLLQEGMTMEDIGRKAADIFVTVERATVTIEDEEVPVGESFVFKNVLAQVAEAALRTYCEAAPAVLELSKILVFLQMALAGNRRPGR